MTVSVRPWDRIAKDLRAEAEEWNLDFIRGPLLEEAAVAGDALAAEVARLTAELEESQLRSIEARNPGIDMDEVAAVHTALDQYDKDHDFNAAAEFTLSAIAKAVGR